MSPWAVFKWLVVPAGIIAIGVGFVWRDPLGVMVLAAQLLGAWGLSLEVRVRARKQPSGRWS